MGGPSRISQPVQTVKYSERIVYEILRLWNPAYAILRMVRGLHVPVAQTLLSNGLAAPART